MKNKKNNKGFTLVELLAVLVILITILTIAIPSITSSVERNKEKMLQKKYDIIEASAATYVSMNKNKITYDKFKNGECYIKLEDIKSDSRSDLSTDDLKDANDKEITGTICFEDNKYVFKPSGDTSVCTSASTECFP